MIITIIIYATAVNKNIIPVMNCQVNDKINGHVIDILKVLLQLLDDIWQFRLSSYTH